MFSAGKFLPIVLLSFVLSGCGGGDDDTEPSPLAFSVSSNSELIGEGEILSLNYDFSDQFLSDVTVSVDKGEVDPQTQTVTWQSYLVERDTLESIQVTATDGEHTYTQVFEFTIVDTSYVFHFEDPDVPKQNFWDDRNYASPNINQAYLEGLVRTDVPINIAISEQGVLAHPDLPALAGSSGLIDAEFYHGTMVGSVLVAEQNNGQGIAGMVSNASLYRVDVFSGDWVSYLIEHNIPVINASHAGFNCYYHPDLQREIDRYAEWGGILTVSAGNSHGLTKQACNNTIVVAAVTKDGEKAHFTDRGDSVTISAIGEQVYLAAEDAEYEYANGTSFSAPQLAAAVAIAKQKYPSLNYSLAVLALTQSAKPFPEDTLSDGMGAGILDIYAFLQWLDAYYGD